MSADADETGPAPTASPAKACCMCGIDLAAAKRQRDSAGRYWCLSCTQLDARAAKLPPDAPLCPDCGTLTPEPVEIDGLKVCARCAAIRSQEAIDFADRRLAVTFDPELRLRRCVRLLIIAAAAFTGVAVFRYAALGALVSLLKLHAAYFGRTRLRFINGFDDWLNVVAIALPLLAAPAIGLAIVIRRKDRLASYDRRMVKVENGLVALLERHQSQTVVERTEPVRRLVHRAVRRVEAAAGRGAKAADRLVSVFDIRHDARPMYEFLKSDRPGQQDLVARNREIETLAYLDNDWDAAAMAVTAVLLRMPGDIDALSRQGAIYCAIREFDLAKKTFSRVIKIARQRNDELANADGLANLGLAHQLLEEIDDAYRCHNRALFKYKEIEGHEDRQADCYGNIGFIHSRKGQADEAEMVFRMALALNRKLNRVEGMALDYGVLGLMVYNKEQGNLREAERMLRRALDLNNQIDRFGAVAANYGNIGLVRAKKRDYKNARKMLRQALSIYQRLNRPKMVAKVQGMLNQITKTPAAPAKPAVAVRTAQKT